MIRQMRSGGKYYFQFIKDGKRHNGVCDGCTTKREAEAFERKLKETTVEAAKKKTLRSLIESFRDDLTDRENIRLADAFELSLKKPHKREAAEKFLKAKREIFKDFVAFMEDTHPDIQELAAVTRVHAEEYISLIRQSGRYLKKLDYIRNGKTISRAASTIPSSRTANLYQDVCAEVFNLLSRDAGLVENPFSMQKLKKAGETREAFTMAELKLIYDHLDNFTRPLFTMAIMTALREGDICTLKWTDLNLPERVIRKVMNKTGRLVEIPIPESLFRYLQEQKAAAKGSEYVFPEHAEMYKRNSTGVSYRVKQFLEGIGIKTTRKPKGRSQAISVKDLHSCRHTFCYFAGMRGIPLAVVQSIVGHMTPEMTKHYSAHATIEDKRRNMLEMADFMPHDAKLIEAKTETVSTEPERMELKRLIETLPIDEVKNILSNLKGA